MVREHWSTVAACLRACVHAPCTYLLVVDTEVAESSNTVCHASHTAFMLFRLLLLSRVLAWASSLWWWACGSLSLCFTDTAAMAAACEAAAAGGVDEVTASIALLFDTEGLGGVEVLDVDAEEEPLAAREAEDGCLREEEDDDDDAAEKELLVRLPVGRPEESFTMLDSRGADFPDDEDDKKEPLALPLCPYIPCRLSLDDGRLPLKCPRFSLVEAASPCACACTCACV